MRTVIRDPIYKDIEINDIEKKIINCADFQRLHRIKQLGMAYLIYPGAKHCRFEHSIGTMHLAGRIAKNIGYDDYWVQTTRLAALLHDIGHVAFSHTSESVTVPYFGNHEKNGLNIIKNSEIIEYINEHYKDIIKIYNGTKNDIICSDVGADRIDYLMRDTYYTGANYGNIDIDRIINNTELKHNKLCIYEKSISAVEALLIGRYLMFKNVYNHKINHITNAMYKSALRNAIEKGFDVVKLKKLGDDETLNELKKYDNKINLLLDRKLFKVAKKMNKNEIRKNEYDKLVKSLSKSEFEILFEEKKFGSYATNLKIINEKGQLNEISNQSKLIKILNEQIKDCENEIYIICEKNNISKVKNLLK